VKYQSTIDNRAAAPMREEWADAVRAGYAVWHDKATILIDASKAWIARTSERGDGRNGATDGQPTVAGIGSGRHRPVKSARVLPWGFRSAKSALARRRAVST